METEQKLDFHIKSEIKFEEFPIFNNDTNSYYDGSEVSLIKSEFHSEDYALPMIKLEQENVHIKPEPTEEIIIKNEVSNSSDNSRVNSEEHNEYNFVEKNLLVRQDPGSNKVYCCAICEYQTPQKSNVIRHFRIHSREKPFACHLCPYRSSQKSILQKHINTHSGDKPFHCELCFTKFTRKCSLLRHLPIHQEDKPFKCKLCDYKCAQSSNLCAHMKAHYGEKPYKCKICHYKTSHKSHLNRHMKTHFKEKQITNKIDKLENSEKILRTNT